MTRRIGLLLPLAFALACEAAQPPRVLVLTHTAGYRHESIDSGAAALMALGQANGFSVDTTADPLRITEDSLRNYSAVVFLHTTGDVLARPQEVDLQRFIQAGGGFVGIHAAADAEYDWHWYGRMVGGYFASHPAIQPATLRLTDTKHQSTAHLPEAWERSDEWYNFKRRADGPTVLMTIDESSYSGGTQNGDHPMAWFHEYDGGRAWYTALGHTNESWSDSLFLKHVLGGVQYAIGSGRPDYRKATALRVPVDSALVRIPLTNTPFSEPTELAVLPNNDVFITERGGNVLRFREGSAAIDTMLRLAVYSRTTRPNVNAEEGLLGITLDPSFGSNSFVYLFYSPRDTSVNRLSRFTYTGERIDSASEKIILEFYSQRDMCCHTGGSLTFGPDRTLYLSTGDNTTPFDEKGERYPSKGFAPIDDRPGHEPFDARRTSANPNDLRGKILRIRINEDGTYAVPAGNLFAPGTAGTKPEIFVMGNRNPYRISVDRTNGVLYWGEVGPDAASDSAERGPRGYDEINRADKAGNFGWPMFIGDNYAYHAYDYATGRTGSAFDAAKPLNDSRNNTGLRELPPAQRAFIWYPYGESSDFPKTGSGGRTAMAGPVVRNTLLTSRHANALPEYYEGKLLIYDWIRDWVMAVSIDSLGRYDAMERILDSAKFAAPIDMETGPDGRIYVLEYGKGWFTRNPDAGLSRIEFQPRPRTTTGQNR